MADFPTTLLGAKIFDVSDATTTNGITITASATPNTKGSWTEITSSLAEDADGIILNVLVNQNGGEDYLMDIAVGAAGAEKVIIPDLLMCVGSSIAYRGRCDAYIPIPIPAGTRISARCQSSFASGTAQVALHFTRGGFFADSRLRKMVAFGTDASDSGGTSVDPGATANTKGAWTQIISTTDIHPARQVLVALGNNQDSVRANATWLIDVAIGASGAEKVIIPNLLANSGSSGDQVRPSFHGPFPISLPSGIRLSARSQCSINTAGDRLLDVAVYLLY